MPKKDDKTATKFGPIVSDEQWTAQGWEVEPVELTVAPNLGAAITIRLDSDEARLVRRAARMSEKTLSEFVRAASLATASDITRQSDSPAIRQSPVDTAPTPVSAKTTAVSPRRNVNGPRRRIPTHAE